MYIKKFFFLLILLLFFVFGKTIVDQNPDERFFENAFLVGDNTALIKGFRFPLLWYFTIPFYYLFGQNAFWIIPLFCFIGGFLFLIKTFENFGIGIEWLFFCWLIVFKSIWFIGQYTRDSLAWFLGCCFTFYFLDSWYKKKYHFGKLLLLAIFCFMTRPQMIIFDLLFVLLLLRYFTEKHKIDWSVFVPQMAGIAMLFYTGAKDTIGVINSGITYTLNFKIEYLRHFYYTFGNLLNPLGLFCFFLSKEKLLLFIVLSSFFIGMISGVPTTFTDDNNDQIVFRYGFVLTPLLIFFVSRDLKGFFNAKRL